MVAIFYQEGKRVGRFAINGHLIFFTDSKELVMYKIVIIWERENMGWWDWGRVAVV